MCSTLQREYYLFPLYRNHLYGILYQIGRICHVTVSIGNLDNIIVLIKTARPQSSCSYAYACYANCSSTIFSNSWKSHVYQRATVPVTIAKVPLWVTRKPLKSYSSMLSLFSLKSTIITLSLVFFLQANKLFYNNFWSYSSKYSKIACKQYLSILNVTLRAHAGANTEIWNQQTLTEWMMWPWSSQGFLFFWFPSWNLLEILTRNRDTDSWSLLIFFKTI